MSGDENKCPFTYNVADWVPIAGRNRQTRPLHLAFRPGNCKDCSFVTRKFDYHPLAIPAPYNHSNINSDEVIYYVAGNFMSRRGVEISSFTDPPAGLPHGTHPGTDESSICQDATAHLPAMSDTTHPLALTRAALDPDTST